MNWRWSSKICTKTYLVMSMTQTTQLLSTWIIWRRSLIWISNWSSSRRRRMRESPWVQSQLRVRIRQSMGITVRRRDPRYLIMRRRLMWAIVTTTRSAPTTAIKIRRVKVNSMKAIWKHPKTRSLRIDSRLVLSSLT